MANDKIIREIKELKNDFPLYNAFVELEYQLDLDKVVVLASFPYENEENSDYEMEWIGDLEVGEVYNFLKELDNRVEVIVTDTTDGDFFHEDTLENTLKEYANLFTLYGAGRDWEVK